MKVLSNGFAPGDGEGGFSSNHVPILHFLEFLVIYLCPRYVILLVLSCCVCGIVGKLEIDEFSSVELSSLHLVEGSSVLS